MTPHFLYLYEDKERQIKTDRRNLMIHNSILEAIGNTPLVKLQKVTGDLPLTVAAKVEYLNPGQSIKDRIALQMIEDAEKKGTHQAGRNNY